MNIIGPIFFGLACLCCFYCFVMQIKDRHVGKKITELDYFKVLRLYERKKIKDDELRTYNEMLKAHNVCLAEAGLEEIQLIGNAEKNRSRISKALAKIAEQVDEKTNSVGGYTWQEPSVFNITQRVEDNRPCNGNRHINCGWRSDHECVCAECHALSNLTLCMLKPEQMPGYAEHVEKIRREKQELTGSSRLTMGEMLQCREDFKNEDAPITFGSYDMLQYDDPPPEKKMSLMEIEFGPLAYVEETGYEIFSFSDGYMCNNLHTARRYWKSHGCDVRINVVMSVKTDGPWQTVAYKDGHSEIYDLRHVNVDFRTMMGPPKQLLERPQLHYEAS
jgi:hypothetical protein